MWVGDGHSELMKKMGTERGKPAAGLGQCNQEGENQNFFAIVF